MKDLRKTLASAFIATALLGGTVATPAFAGGDSDKDSKSKSYDHRHKNDKKYCEDADRWYTHKQFHKRYGWDADHAGWWDEKNKRGDNECDDDNDRKRHYDKKRHYDGDHGKKDHDRYDRDHGKKDHDRYDRDHGKKASHRK